MKIKYKIKPYPEDSVIYWLNQIEKVDIKERALKNYKKVCLKNNTNPYDSTNIKSISSAISAAFSWNNSSEGMVYWAEIRKTYDKR